MDEADGAAILAAFQSQLLPKPQWDHEAHLAVCWSVLNAHDPFDALTYLRGAIRAYNDATGTPNTERDGYHETLTRYYIGAVAHLVGQPLDEVLTARSCTRAAPAEHWSRDRLFSPGARADWVPPDLRPLPWPIPGCPAGRVPTTDRTRPGAIPR